MRFGFWRRPLARVQFVLLALLLAVATPARADSDDAPSRPAETNINQIPGDDDDAGPSIFAGIPALAPIGAFRDTLAAKGFRFSGLYLGDPYSDRAGGLKRGTTFSGRLDVRLDVEAGKVFGLEGGTFHANMFQIHGHDVSKNNVGNLLSINDIAALPVTRLYELWYEQKFGDKLAVRAGQIGIDVEFLVSDYAASFVNATFGWPGLPTLNLPEGGPAYPLATPAVRVKLDPTPQLSILAAVFDGEPAGPGAGDPQTRDRYGLNFRVTDPALVFLEGQYRYDQAADALGLPGKVKLGAFSHFGRFGDQRFGTDGLSLASTASNGMPVQHSPDAGFYGIIDQMIYRAAGDNPQKGIGVFARAIGSPGTQNLVDFYADAGVNVIGMVPSRPADTFGAAVAYAKIAAAARAYDRDLNAATGLAAPVRDFEAVFELNYNAQIVPGLNLQPDLQYVIHPGGHVANPFGDGLTPIPNAWVLGVSTHVRF